MVITPSSDVILLKCPLELSQDNQLSFTNKNTQYNYFYGLPKYVAGTNFTYVRKDGVLRIPENFDDLVEYNYVMYRNDAYSNKWFYAFIDKMEYVNDGMTAVSISTDCFQTWQFDLEYKRTFVEREHVNDDTIGLHTIDEGLDTGEYIINGVENVDYVSSGTDYPYLAVGVTEVPTTSRFQGLDKNMTTQSGMLANTSYVNGLPSGLSYLILDPFAMVGANPLTWVEKLDLLISLYNYNSKEDSIQTIFPIPLGMMTGTPVNWDTYEFFGVPIRVGLLGNSASAKDIITTSVAKSNTLDGYTPKNNKLYTYPFSYIHATNNGGSDVIYRYEDFNGTPSFKTVGAFSPNMSIKTYPVNYKRTSGTNAYDYGMTGQKIPTCSWNTDYYVSWYNQQGSNLAIQTQLAIGQYGANLLGNAMTGNITGGISNTFGVLSQIQDVMQKKREAELVPQQAKGNINSSDVNYSAGKSGFSFYKMSVRNEMARCIDDWFSMFGYKVNRVKTPNISGRKNWNYIKTIGCYILADIPQEDLDTIKKMFDRGITIWHHANTFMDYSQSNAII